MLVGSRKTTNRRAGYATIVGHGFRIKEFDTATCVHCNHVWVVRSNNPDLNADLGGWCTLCSKGICPDCIGKECFPFERKLDMYERSQALYAQVTGNLDLRG